LLFAKDINVLPDINQRLTTFSWNHPSLVKLNALFKFDEKKKDKKKIRVLALIGAQLRTAVRIMPILLKRYASATTETPTPPSKRSLQNEFLIISHHGTVAGLYPQKILPHLSVTFAITYFGGKWMSQKWTFEIDSHKIFVCGNWGSSTATYWLRMAHTVLRIQILTPVRQSRHF